MLVPGDTDPAPQALKGPVEVLAAQRFSGPSREFLERVPREYARRHLILSAGVDASGVEVLRVSTVGTPAHAVHNVGVRLGRSVQANPEPSEQLAAAIDRAYEQHAVTKGRSALADTGEDHLALAVEVSGDLEGDVREAIANADRDLLHVDGKGPVVRLVDLLFFEALHRHASDIHVQPLSDRGLVRYRLDGVLHTVRELPPALIAPVVSRIKVMARMDLAEKRAPQDGRATVTLGRDDASGAHRRIDLRISTLPTTYGERVVVRLLDTARSPHLLRFAALGMPAPVEAKFQQQASRTSGIVLVTGPTGSGKTTTLYTTLSWISQVRSGAPSSRGCGLNIMTIEDPVEYDLSTAGLAISQTQLNAKKGVTFAAGLRHILRQDPDVIMVGEVRDDETARIAVQASLTGHLVLSTLHTNDAPSAVARILDLGVEPFLVSSSLSAILAQRLVRTLHRTCRGFGCEDCMRTGFRGRTGVFELLVVDEELRGLIADRVNASVIRQRAMAKGMVPLLEAGLRLVDSGLSSEAEVRRVIEGLEGGLDEVIV